MMKFIPINQIPATYLKKGEDPDLLKSAHIQLFDQLKMTMLAPYSPISNIVRLLENKNHFNQGKKTDNRFHDSLVRFPLVVANDTTRLIFFEYVTHAGKEEQEELAKLCNSLGLKYFTLKQTDNHPLNFTTKDFGLIMTLDTYNAYMRNGTFNSFQ